MSGTRKFRIVSFHYTANTEHDPSPLLDHRDTQSLRVAIQVSPFQTHNHSRLHHSRKTFTLSARYLCCGNGYLSQFASLLCKKLKSASLNLQVSCAQDRRRSQVACANVANDNRALVKKGPADLRRLLIVDTA